MTIEHPRRLNFQTPVRTTSSILIAAPITSYGKKAARAIQMTLRDVGADTELLVNPPGSIMKEADGPVIVVGNLADSLCVRELYFRFLCATDLWYPGPGGYELRTLCDPFGTGNNVILCGYSDEEGADAGTEKLRSRLNDPIPHLVDLKVTRLPLADEDVEQCRQESLPDQAWEIANSHLGDQKGYLYYLSGDPKLGEEYRKVWEAIVASGYEKTENIVQAHLYSLMRLLPWRLVEDMSLFSEEERLVITRFIYGWAESKEGWLHVLHCPRVQLGVPRQNHELIPALALAFAADYFTTHFPGIPGPKNWLEAAKRAYEPYGPFWKPLCDGLCHGWWMSQPVILEYALQDSEHTFFEEGGARKAAECAMAVVNNDGWLPSAGDSDLRRQFPGPSLRVAAAYFNDGRYQFAHELAPPNRRFAWLTTLPRTFDVGIKPRVPEDQIGVTVIPVDRPIYDIWERDPKQAPGAATTPPSAPIEQCFDKLSVRTGWELKDDYLLIDGLGGGSHSYDDAGGVLEYVRLGVSVIVQEDSFVHSAPEHHSVVTIVKDGESGVIPGFAILETNETDRDGTIYLRIRLKDYAGADWVREVYLRPKGWVVFNDTVTANQAGDYAVEAHFRTPTRLVLDGHIARGRRHSPCVEKADVYLESLCEPSQLTLIEEPIHLRYQSEKDQARWKERYRTDEVVLMSFVARKPIYLEAGESIRLTHLIQACGPGEKTVGLIETEDGIYVANGEKKEHLKTFISVEPSISKAVVEKKNERRPIRIFDIEDPITAFCPLADRAFVAGTVTGKLKFFDFRKDFTWSVDLVGPVHDIGFVQGESILIAIGHGPAHLTAFDDQGHLIWEREIERDPCPWPWWELPTPAAVQVAGGIHHGVPFFAVGCGDIKMRCFDAKGEEKWRWRYNEGVPGRIRVADIDGSGEDRIVVGGDILSDQSTCRILDPDGNLLTGFGVEGWTSVLTALTFGKTDTRYFIGCGANRGANLHLYEFKEEDSAKSWQRLWLKRLGGRVTGIRIFGVENRLLAGTSQGFLLFYDLEGKLIWSKLFAQGIGHLVPLGSNKKTLIVDNVGGLRLVSLSGDIHVLESLPSPCAIAMADATSVYLVCGTEVWRI